MKLTIFILLSTIGFTQAQNANTPFLQNIRVYSEVSHTGYPVIYADNLNATAATITITFNIVGGSLSPVTEVVQGKGVKKKIYEFKPANRSGDRGKSMPKFGSPAYRYNVQRGSTYGSKHDKKHVYVLPFPEGVSCKIGQGYDGTYSHKKKKALDFSLQYEAEICAIRDGVVTDMVESKTRGCPDERCLYESNFVWIEHDDGTAAMYAHIAPDGVTVEIGDEVKAGQVIAHCGATGFAGGPHLHLEVFEIKRKKYKSVPTLFLVDSLGTTGYLEQGVFYTNYAEKK